MTTGQPPQEQTQAERPQTEAQSERPREDTWPTPGRAWTAVFLLALASIASQFDRTVINLAVDPVKKSFALNDSQFILLQTLAFGLFYVLACVPIGRLADRYSRKIVLGVCLGLFSVFAMASGLARSYAQLFLTRIGVGVGEASVTPTALSMLSDLFPPDRLSRPVGAFLMSSPIGQGLALIGGGLLLQWLSTSGLLDSGLLGGLEPWQAAFVIVGLPGLLLVPAFLLMHEPKRRGAGGDKPLTIREVWKVFTDRSSALVPMFAGFCLVILVAYAYAFWSPTFLQRTYGWNPRQAGVGFGLVMLIFGTSGAYFAGWLSDRLTQRGMTDAQLKVGAFGFVGCGIFGALATQMPNAYAALAFLAPAIFLSVMPIPCAGASIQLIVPNRARAQISAFYITLTTLVGLFLGPQVVALMTDYIFENPADIRHSLAWVVSVPTPIMCILLLYACKPYRALRAAQAGGY